MADALKVRVVSPAATVFEGSAAAVVAPAWDGRVGILPGHSPLISLLGAGALTVDKPGGGSRSWYVERGVVKVEDDTVVVLTDHASEDMPDTLPRDAIMRRKEMDEVEADTSPGNPLV